MTVLICGWYWKGLKSSQTNQENDFFDGLKKPERLYALCVELCDVYLELHVDFIALGIPIYIYIYIYIYIVTVTYAFSLNLLWEH